MKKKGKSNAQQRTDHKRLGQSERTYKKADDTLYIYGKHVVDRALEYYSSAIKTVWIESDFSDQKLLAKVRRLGCKVEVLNERRLPGTVSREVNHQGIVAAIPTAAIVQPYARFMQLTTISAESCFLVLSEIQDPQNVGAMIRSAAAFGVQAVLLPKHKQAPLTGTVAKVSVGMIFTVPIVAVGNLNTTLADLKERGVTVLGLAAETGSFSLYEQDLTGASAFVVGNEATGLREQTKEVCDVLLHIPMHPRCESLNASAAVVASLTVRAQQRAK